MFKYHSIYILFICSVKSTVLIRGERYGYRLRTNRKANSGFEENKGADPGSAGGKSRYHQQFSIPHWKKLFHPKFRNISKNLWCLGPLARCHTGRRKTGRNRVPQWWYFQKTACLFPKTKTLYIDDDRLSAKRGLNWTFGYHPTQKLLPSAYKGGRE